MFKKLANWLKNLFSKKRIGPIVPTPTGDIDIGHPDGVPDVTPPDIVIGSIPTLTATAGAAFSFPLAGYVTGADAAGATYSIVNFVGTLAGIGGALSTSTIAGTGIAGTWTGQLVVTSGVTPFPGPTFTINVIAVQVTDNVAPVTPLAPSVAVVGTSATVTGLWPADVRTATIGPSDPVKVILERSVNGGIYSTLTTLTAEGPQPSPVRVSATIGTLTSPSSTHDGKNLSVTVADGIFSSAIENVGFEGWQVSGAFDLVMTVPAYVSGYDWTFGGPMIRASLDSRAIAAVIARRPDAAGKGTAAMYRLEQDGAIGWSGDANLAGDVTLRISRTYPGNVVSFHWFDASTSSWVQWASQVVNLPQLVYAGFAGARSQPGAAITISATNAWLNAYGSYSYADTVASPNVYAWRATARDSATSPNSSAASEVTTRSTATSTQKKWNPGHYVLLDSQIRKDNRAQVMAEHFSNIAELANEPTVRGVKIFVQWSSLEGNTAGDYAAGLAMIQQYLDRCAAVGKQLMISINHQQFGGSGSDKSIFFPAYIANGAAYGWTAMFNGITTRHWQQATMDRLLALDDALAAAFDSHPNFELVTNGETSIGVTAGVDGFSNTALKAQLDRKIAHAATTWLQTNFRISTNYLSPDSLFQSLIANIAACPGVIGGPDVIPKENIQANRIFTGQLGGIDYRGVIPFASEVQSPSLGGHEGTWTPAQLYAMAMDGGSDPDSGASGSGLQALPTRPQYFVWYRNEWQSGSAQRWSTGILPFIRSINGAVSNGLDSVRRSPTTVARPSGY